MKEHPAPFKAEMVRAILEGRKTQTRRILTEHNTLLGGYGWTKRMKNLKHSWDGAHVDGPSPYGESYLHLPFIDGTSHRVYPKWQVGDRLWVRESGWIAASKGAFIPNECNSPPPGGYKSPNGDPYKRCPSIHMPRWASRVTLEVKAARIERLNDITNEGALMEGCRGGESLGDGYNTAINALEAFMYLWHRINGKKGEHVMSTWSANPWVAVTEFKRV